MKRLEYQPDSPVAFTSAPPSAVLPQRESLLVDQFLSRIDAELHPLLEAVQEAIDSRSRIPVLSQWRFIRFLPLLAAHLHLRWPGRISNLGLCPKIGIYPIFGEQDQYGHAIYSVHEVQTATRQARTLRAASGAQPIGLYPDWEQAIDRNSDRVGGLTLPAASFLSVDRVGSNGELKQGTRRVLGRIAPRNQLRPRILIPARSEISRAQIRGFSDVDLVFVNVQNVGGKQLTEAISFFLNEFPPNVPVVIVASSPAELAAVNLSTETASRIRILHSDRDIPRISTAMVGKDRALAERQFAFAIDGLDERGPLMRQLLMHTTRVWWATRQSISEGEPRELEGFRSLLDAARNSVSQHEEVPLLNEATRLIEEHAKRPDLRAARREAIITAALNDGGSTQLIIVRSDSAAVELRKKIASEIDVTESDLELLGIRVQSVFAPWPDESFDRFISAGYFGSKSLDAMFASGAKRALLVADPIEARVALFDIERKYKAIAQLPARLKETLNNLVSTLESEAATFADASKLVSILFDRGAHSNGSDANRERLSRAVQILLFFTDGSSLQVSSNSRMEVLGRQRLKLQNLPAKDLHVGDQVVLLNEEEREAFSERLLKLLDDTAFKEESASRRQWLTLIQAMHAQRRISVSEVREGLAVLGFAVDAPTVRSWLPLRSVEGCGVPERSDMFLALASALGMTLGNEILLHWFRGIERLRKRHRRVGRDLARAIRGAYLGRLDPLSIAKMEKEWGIAARALLEAARVAVVDELIPLGVIDFHD
jgi:hypothetical protein